jgi:sialic acid synthase SpsE
VKTLVIAECGSCHDRSLSKAFRLIAAAKDAGADVAKFQFWSDAGELAMRRRVPDLYRAIYERYQVPQHWLYFLEAACSQHGLEFMCTAYLPEDVRVVAPFVQRFKISSFEANDDAMVLAHAPYSQPLIISLGMNGNYWRFHCTTAQLLHCVSAYPAPVDAMNLRVLWSDPDGEPMFHGLSDHSRHPLMGALAVAAGAQIIEAHIRLDDTDPKNPDYETAFSPKEFAGYVDNIRVAERAMGDGERQLQACELPMARFRVGGV